jgi:hypothetical protein
MSEESEKSVPAEQLLKSENAPNPPPVSPAQGEPCNNKDTQSEAKKLTLWEKFERIFTAVEFIALITAIPTAIFIGYQWREMVKASKVSEKQLAVMQGQTDVMKRQMDDSEAQQRAWLQIDQFDIKLTTNSISPNYPGKYKVQVSFVIKNVGATIATDLHMSGESIDDDAERFDKMYGFTNQLAKWNGGIQVPSPAADATIIMPQQTMTNIHIIGYWNYTNGIYVERWISYRDIFGHADIVGVGGKYDFTNDNFAPQFIYQRRYDQTNTSPNR